LTTNGRTAAPHVSNGKNGRREAHESVLYSHFSHFYDLVFGRVFLPRVARVIRGLEIPAGARVLELGVGTGAALSAYPHHCHVTGLDLSEAMLREARARIARKGWKHVDVVQGDAMRLPFPDDAFDYVMAFHVVTVVPEPDHLMREAIRVCRPGGLVTVVNRFRSDSALLDRVEKRLEPVTLHWGWRTLRREEVFDPYPLEILSARHGGPYGLFTAVVARNLKAERAATR
jgi:phosphatidylethanolamine/phosphatidyl-N-methylethanolamine N-methyltransferase